MKLKQALFGEHSVTKVAAVFDNRGSAETVANELRQVAGMEEAQVKLVGPNDINGVSGVGTQTLSRKLEPEQAGIWRTILRTHLVTGATGVVAGALLYLIFRMAGNAAVASNPLASLGVMLFFGGIFGLMLGGLIALRPDHYRVVALVRKAIKRGRWAVVTHPVNHQQTSLVLDQLHRRGARVVRSL